MMINYTCDYLSSSNDIRDLTYMSSFLISLLYKMSRLNIILASPWLKRLIIIQSMLKKSFLNKERTRLVIIYKLKVFT